MKHLERMLLGFVSLCAIIAFWALGTVVVRVYGLATLWLIPAALLMYVLGAIIRDGLFDEDGYWNPGHDDYWKKRR